MVRLDEGGRQRGICLIAPPAALIESIEHLWLQPQLPKSVWRVVPDVSAHVIFSFRRAGTGSAAVGRVIGARTSSFDVDMTGRVRTIGARLRPGILPSLRDDASQITDRSVPLEDIAGRAGLTLIERMADAGRDEALELFIRFLAERLSAATPALPPHVILHSTSVTGIARTLGISRRGVYDKLSASIGLSPKRALRIQRLHRALSVLNTGASPVDAAARAGYCDQAHFTREATSLLGEPPAAWRNRGCSFLQDTARPAETY